MGADVELEDDVTQTKTRRAWALVRPASGGVQSGREGQCLGLYIQLEDAARDDAGCDAYHGG
jgi:hypothetical protein